MPHSPLSSPPLRLFALLFFVAALAAAPACAAAQPETQPAVTASYYLLSLGPPVRDLAISNKGQVQVLQVPNGNPGAPVSYQGPRQINFYRASSLAAGNGTATHAAAPHTAPPNATAPHAAAAMAAIPEGLQPIAQATLPQGNNPALLLFLPQQAQGESIRIAALPVNEQRFRSGSFYFQNFTPEAMAVNVNGETVVLQAQQGSYLATANDGDGNIVRMAKADADGGAPELFYQSRWPRLGARRAWVFFLPGPDGKVQVHRYYDTPAAGSPSQS